MRGIARMSKLLVRSQLDGVLGLQAQRKATGGAQAVTKKNKEEGSSASRRSRRQAQRSAEGRQAPGRSRAAAATPLDKLRSDIAKSRSHMTKNIAALSLKASDKRRRQTAALTRKLLQSRHPLETAEGGSSSSDDEDRVDMYDLLRKMQSKGM